jgi:hypothetical protein
MESQGYGLMGFKGAKIFYIFSLVKDNDFLFNLNEMRDSEKIV